tara:strand:- start:2167 stop:11805 length:9639 start_codon:yes stop_codon:yes gene_type:complete
MNEEAIKDAYDLFVSTGYRQTIEEFKVLLHNEDGAVTDAYKLFVSTGYRQSKEDFKNLMGVGIVEPVKKKDTTDSTLEDGGLEQSDSNNEKSYAELDGRDLGNNFEPKRLSDEEQLTQDTLEAEELAKSEELAEKNRIRNFTYEENVEWYNRPMTPQNTKSDGYTDPMESITMSGRSPENPEEYARATRQRKVDLEFTNQQVESSAPALEKQQTEEAVKILEERKILAKERAEVLESEGFGLALDATDSKSIELDEVDAVKYFTDLYGKFGFFFRKSGLGDAIDVVATDGTPITIDLQTFFSNEGEAARLKEFVSNHALTPDEIMDSTDQDIIDRAERVRSMRTTARINPDGSESTVLMASAEVDGKYVAYPTLFPNSTNYNSNPVFWDEKDGLDAYKEARERGEVFTFDTDDEAQDFAEGSWKDVDVLDAERKIFYQKRGIDYAQYKKMYDRYEEVMDEISFIEGQNYGLQKARGEDTKEALPFKEEDLTEEQKNQRPTEYLYVNGRKRNDIDQYLLELNTEASELRDVVDQTNVSRAREDFDLVLDKKLQQRIMVAAEANYKAKAFEDVIQKESLNRFGVRIENISQVTPETPEDAEYIDFLNVANEKVKGVREIASTKYEIAKTYLDAKVDKFARKEFAENWSAVVSSFSGGWNTGNIGNKLLLLSMGVKDLGDDATTQEVAEYIVRQKELQAKDKTPRALSRYHSSRNWDERFDALGDDPLEIMFGMASQSISQLLPYGLKIVPAVVATEALAGGIIGSTGFLAGPLGIPTTGAGLLAGGINGLKDGMAITMVALEYTNAVMEAVVHQGYNPMDPDSMVKALRDPDVWAEGKRIGLKRGIAIAIIDRLSMGLAGRLYTVGKLASTGVRMAAVAAERVTLDPITEAFGEWVAQKVSGQRLSMADVMDEAIGGMGMNAPAAAVNMYVDGRKRNNIKIADEFGNLRFIAESKYSSKKIADWSNNMVKLGQISPEQGQRINENIGLREDARGILDTGKRKSLGQNNTAVENRVMELLAAKKELSKNTNSKEIFSEKIKRINKEISEIVSSRTLRKENLQEPLDGIGLNGHLTTNKTDARETVPTYMIDGKRIATKEKFIELVGKMTKKKRDKSTVRVLNDAETGTKIKEIYAIQKSSTESVDAQEQTEDSEAVGKRAAKKGEVTEEATSKNNKQTKLNEEGEAIEEELTVEEIAETVVTRISTDDIMQEAQQKITAIEENAKAIKEPKKETIAKITAIKESEEQALEEFESEERINSVVETESNSEVVALENEIAEEEGAPNLFSKPAKVKKEPEVVVEETQDETFGLQEDIADIEGTIEDGNNEIASIQSHIKEDVAAIQKKIAAIKKSKNWEGNKKEDISELKADIQAIKEDGKANIQEVKEDISELKKNINKAKRKIKKIASANPRVNFKTKEESKAISIEEEQQEIDRINALESGNVSTTIESRGKGVAIDSNELSSRTDNPINSVRLEIINGVPTIFTISDQLTTGNVVNPETGNTIDNLKGGIGFNGTIDNDGVAWANTRKENADGTAKKAAQVYKDNINLFDQWWIANPEYKGLVPMAVVKMGEESILSNEATFRVLADNLTEISSENKTNALSVMRESMAQSISNLESNMTGKKKSKSTLDNYEKNIKSLKEILRVTKNINSIEEALTPEVLNKLGLPTRVLLLKALTSSGPNKPGETKGVGISNKTVVKALLKGMPEGKRSLLNLGVITDLITDPQMKNIPQRSIVAIVGVDVLNPETVKTNHPNYNFGVKGKSIGILEESVPVYDAFPAVFNKAVVGLVKDDLKGARNSKTDVKDSEKAKRKNKDEPLAILGARKESSLGTIYTREIGVQGGMPNLEFIGAISNGNIDNATKLIHFMNTSFPHVVISTDIETFNDVLQSKGVKVYLKGDEIVYGVTVDGDIYINPEAHSSDSELFNTAIHEMGHVWTDYLQTTKKGREIYGKGSELVMQTDEFTKQLELFDGDIKKAVNETMAILIGNKGQTITNASIKSKFEEWLIGLWRTIKEQFKLSSELNNSEIQDLTLDKFLGHALADIFAGEKIKISEAQTVKMRNPEAAFNKSMTMEQIIARGRANGRRDADIRVVLQNRGETQANINNALRVYIDLFTQMPLEFTNVQGGAIVGNALFNTLRTKLNDFSTNEEGTSRVKTYSEIRGKAQDLIQAEPIYKAQAEQIQMELRTAFDRTLNIRGNISVREQISNIRKQLKTRIDAIASITDAQRRMRLIIRDVMPSNTKYAKAAVNKLLKIVNNTNLKNFIGQSEVLLDMATKQRAIIKKQMIKDLIIMVRKKAKFSRTQSGKVRGRGVDAFGQSYFEEAKRILKYAMDENFDALDAYAEEVHGEKVTEQIAEIRQELAEGKSISVQDQLLLDRQLAYDSFAGVVNMELEEVEQLLKDSVLIAKESIARLNVRRAQKKKMIDGIVESFDEEIQHNFPQFYKNGLLLEDEELSNKKPSIRKSWKDNGFLGTMREFVTQWIVDKKTSQSLVTKFLRNNLIHLGSITNILDRGTKGKLFTKHFYKSLNDADERYLKGVFVQEDIMNSFANVIGFKSWKKWRYSLGEGTIHLKNMKNGRTGNLYNETGLTKDKALRIYALSLNEHQKEVLYNQGFTPDVMEEIYNFLGEDNMKMADMVVSYLSDTYFHETNGIFIQANNISLRKVDNYFPTRKIGYKASAADMANGDFNKIFSAEFSPALKERTASMKDMALGYDFSEVFEDHVQQMERYKAYALMVQQMNGILNSPAIKTVLNETGMGKLFKASLNYAINPEAGSITEQDATGWVQSKFSGYALAFKAIQIIKQASSFVLPFENYSFMGKGKQSLIIDIPMFMYDYAKVIAMLPWEIIEARKISATFKHRLKKGMEGDIFGLESGGMRGAPKMRRRRDKLGAVTRAFDLAKGLATVTGDILGVLGYKAVYNRNIANGMNDAEALALFNDFNSTQQTRRATEKNEMQRSTNTFYRAFTMFGSSLFLLMNKVGMSTNNMYNTIFDSNNKGLQKIPKAKDFRAFALAYSGANALFTIAANSAVFLRGDDDDKAAAWKSVREAAMGLSLVWQIPLVGAGLEEWYNAVEGINRPSSAIVNPYSTIFRKMRKAVNEAEKSGDNYKVLLPILELVAGAQATSPEAAIKTLGGDFSDENMYNLLGITKSYRPGYNKTKNKGMTNAQKKMMFPDLWKDMQENKPDSPLKDMQKELRKMKKDMMKEIYGN